jgi:hypothetical protein
MTTEMLQTFRTDWIQSKRDMVIAISSLIVTHQNNFTTTKYVPLEATWANFIFVKCHQKKIRTFIKQYN